MKITWSWLQEYLLGEYTLDHVVEALTNLGLEVESVENEAARLKDFIVGHITDTRRHPDADRLQICNVDLGSSSIELVCGGVNARPQIKVAVALPGVVIPSTGQPLKAGKVRGVDSPGMLCSVDELLLSSTRFSKSEGILELPESAPLGSPIADALGLNDAVIDLSVTPNRSDCFAAYGIARDLFAYFSLRNVNVQLRPLSALKTIGLPKITNRPKEDTCLFEHELPPSCYAFSMLKIENLHHLSHQSISDLSKASYENIAQVLDGLSVRRIHPLVDVTNYMCVLFGRPMHVFDNNKVQGKIFLRTANDGEVFEGLDDKTYTLSKGMLVICDEDGIISLAGIMGGKRTACDDHTTNVLLESAWFDPVSIATTGQKLNIISDARMRFERGVDPSLVQFGIEHAAFLIQSMCGGNVADYDAVFQKSAEGQTIYFAYDDVTRVTGQAISTDYIIQALGRLGCDIRDIDPHGCTVRTPTWRHDLEKSIDLIEEIVRLRGVESIKELPLPSIQLSHYESSGDTLKRLCAKMFVEKGYTEALCFSFIDHATAKLFTKEDHPLLCIQNPITQDLTTMRPSLLPSLLKAVSDNQKRSLPTIALFETAPIYGEHLQNFQRSHISGVWAGKNHPRHWQKQQRDVTFFEIKDHVLDVLQFLGINALSLQQKTEDLPSYYHPYQSISVCQGARVIAYVGMIHPKILKSMDVVGPVAAFEIMLDHVPPIKQAKTIKSPTDISPFQPVERDFSFTFSKNFPVGNLYAVLYQKLTRQKTFPKDVTLQHVTIFDVFERPEQHEKSVAVSLRLQPEKATFSEQDLESIHATVTALVLKETGGILRQH